MTGMGQVTAAMIAYYTGDARRIHHFLKVYGLAKAIGEGEGLEAGTQRVLEMAALTHDIGIRISERKYHSAAGNYQELEGPPEARALLAGLGVEADTLERVCWLIAHHHTYDSIQGADYQILVEADFLVNMGEDAMSAAAIAHGERMLFKTQTGKAFLHALTPEAQGQTET